MLGFFPYMYEDELLYSTLARFHLRSGNNNDKDTLMNLFDNRTTSAVIDFPSNLDNLARKVNQEPKLLIHQHTLFPYYNPYITKKVAQKIIEQMTFGNSESIFLTLGLAASKVKGPDYFRYCLHCYLIEKELYGEAYWHRTHQLPGVYICPIHKDTLWISDVPYRNKINRHRFFPLVQSCVDNGKKVSDIPTEFYPYLLFIAKQSYALINSNLSFLRVENIDKFYLRKLRERNYLTPSGNIRIQKLIRDFLDFFPSYFLNLLNSEFDYYDEDTWLHKVLRKPKVTCHPLRHILLLLFLDQRIEDQLLIKHKELNFFGLPSWPCLNKAAKHYREFIITDCIITMDYKRGKPIGTFTCKECGFSYSRSGPDTSEEDKYRIGRIKKFGTVWQSRLNELYANKTLSIREISSLLGVDSKTTKKFLLNEEKNPSPNNELNVINEKREIFEELRRKYPNYSRTELREVSPKLYGWLYKNDIEWFTDKLPPVKRKVSSTKNKIDWEKRDEEYSQLITIEANALYLEIPLVRVTKTLIYQRLDLRSRFEKNGDKLPGCKNVLEEVTETIEDYYVRKIKYFGEQLRRKNINFSISSLARIAGIKGISNEIVQRAIKDEINLQR